MNKQFYEFNNEQITYILQNYMYYTNQELAEHIGGNCTKNHISRLLRQNGIKKGQNNIPKRSKRIFSESDDQYIKDHYLTMRYADIGSALGFTERQIRGRICNLHLRKTRKINCNYFDNIDTPLKAYFLGFIFADGWVVYNEEKRNYEFGMELQEQDKYILEKLNDEIGGQNIIKMKPPHISYINGEAIHSGQMETLRIYSKQLVQGLMKNGIETNKTLKDTYPVVQDELFFDYLRGYIDGDGCYYYDENNVYMHITCANISVLEFIRNKLMSYGIETRIYTENERKHRLMCINSLYMDKLINKLYYDADVFCLTRKYEKIKHIIGSTTQKYVEN